MQPAGVPQSGIVRQFQIFGPQRAIPMASTAAIPQPGRSQPNTGQQSSAINGYPVPPVTLRNLFTLPPANTVNIQPQSGAPVPPHRLTFTTFDIASLSGLTGYNPDQFHNYFGQAMFTVFKVDQLKAIIRYIRDLYYKQRLPIPRALNLNGRKQQLIDALVEFVVSTATQCPLHSAQRARKLAFTHTVDPATLRSCTCYPSDDAASNAAVIADGAVLKALTEIPNFRQIDGLYTDVEILASAFLRGSGSIHMQFKMDPQKLAQIQCASYRIFLRSFCPNSSRYQNIDNRVLVRVNGQTIIVPPQQFDPKKILKPVVPIDISGFIRSGDQHVFVSSHIVRSVMTVQLVRVLSVAEVVEMVKKKDEIPETSALISKDFGDDDISPSNMLVSLRCPLSMIRMKIPAKASTCNHQQCFDLESVISYCKQYNKWTCPICCNPIKHDDILIDSFFKRIIAGAGPDIDQANIGVDGSIRYIDPEVERRKQEALEERMLKRRRKAEGKDVVPFDVTVNTAVMDGSSYDCPFVID